MERLFLFVFQNRAFFTFLALEAFCFWLLVQNNHYQSARFFNSSNFMVASVNDFSQSIRDYFQLRDVNKTLAEENAALRQALEKQNQATFYYPDTLAVDSAVISRFDFISAKVVNNQVDRFKNFITINKGSQDGIAPGMAVISTMGAIGKVKSVSTHYGVITSLLHIEVMVSATLERTGHFGSVQWNGLNPQVVDLKYIPRHVKPLAGDSVVTSGYNAVFPEGILIGIVEEVDLRDEALFYDITVRLSQDFRKLSFVSVVKSNLKHEQDSLEQFILKSER